MSNEKNLDQMIQEALKGQDQTILQGTAELGWFQLGLKQFTGKLGWVTWVIMIVQIVMFLGAIWCGLRFYAATDMVMALKYGLTAAVLALMATQIKMSLMPAIQADRVIREVKRLQLMVAK